MTKYRVVRLSFPELDQIKYQVERRELFWWNRWSGYFESEQNAKDFVDRMVKSESEPLSKVIYER